MSSDDRPEPLSPLALMLLIAAHQTRHGLTRSAQHTIGRHGAYTAADLAAARHDLCRRGIAVEIETPSRRGKPTRRLFIGRIVDEQGALPGP